MNRSSKSTVSKKGLRVLITTGDPDGIGWEVTCKALNALGPQAGVQFVYFRAVHTKGQKQPKLGSRFRHFSAPSLATAVEQPFDSRVAIEIRSQERAPVWVEEAARACLLGHFDAMVTAPLSKTSIIDAGLKDIGHTEILGRISGQKSLFMGFVGHKFNVVLATGHQPLISALANLNEDTLKRAIEAARQLRRLLPGPRQRKPIGLVGVNPHAGEGGLIGGEEQWMRPLCGTDVQGPLVPDAAFLEKNWNRYSVFVSPYHDQGLIPFKLVHGFAGGVHLTLGLPFVRTSVDHGTAKELYGKNKAQPGSMQDALLMAVKLARQSR